LFVAKAGLDKERKGRERPFGRLFYKNGKPFFLITLLLYSNCGYIAVSLAMTVKGNFVLTR
jgi:hypothetical protein